MTMKLKMVNPHFEVVSYHDESNMYRLTFDGWDGIGNVDEDGDGDEFFYDVTCEDRVYDYAHAFAYGYSWFFNKVYDDDYTDADFSDTEIEIIIHTILEAIKNGGIE